MAGLASLGSGQEVFNCLWAIQVAGILLFLPALTCGAIAHEKERNTLSILLTTRLGAATIVLEKFLSRLVLAFMLLLMSLPLLAVAYSMGGVSLDWLLAQTAFLFVLSVFVGSMSIMCSAWCGSTVSAFFMTYTVAIGLGIVAFLMLVPHLGWFSEPLGTLRIAMVVMLALSTVFVLLAIECLIRRTFVTPRNVVLTVFHGLDAIYNHMNTAFGNIVLTRASSSLPGDEPIAWRETAKKSLGTLRVSRADSGRYGVSDPLSTPHGGAGSPSQSARIADAALVRDLDDRRGDSWPSCAEASSAVNGLARRFPSC